MIKFSATLPGHADRRQRQRRDGRPADHGNHRSAQQYDGLRLLQRCRHGEIRLVRTASLIEQARAEVKNSVLVDNGDVIQGSPLGDYMAAKGLKEGDVHPVYKAMNTLNYAVGNWATMSSITVSTSCTRRWPGRSSPT